MRRRPIGPTTSKDFGESREDLGSITSITFDRETGILVIDGEELPLKYGSKQNKFLAIFFEREYSFEDCSNFKEEFDLSLENNQLSKSSVGKLTDLQKQIFSKIEEQFEIHHSVLFQPKKSKTFSLKLNSEYRKLLKNQKNS